MRGAIIGSYKTLLGIVFNIAAILVMEFFMFVPLGFAASFAVGWALNCRVKIGVFPAIYFLSCIFVVGLALLDPLGVFEYFFD